MKQPKTSSKNLNRVLVNNTTKRTVKNVNAALYGVKVK